MQNLKIVLLIDSLVSGGAQRQLVELALNLDKTRYEPIVCVYHNIPELRPDLDNAGIPVVLIEKKSKLDIRFLLGLIGFFRRVRPDIIHAYLNNASFWARITGRISGVKRIITSERNLDIHFSPFRVFAEKILQHISNAIVVNAEAIKSLLVTRLGVSQAKIHVIYNGVDADKFVQPGPAAMMALRNLLDWREGDCVLSLPGRLAPQKNHLCLIKAVQSLRDDRIKVLFVGNETGGAEYKKMIVSQVHARGLDAQVFFAGRQEDMAAVYAVSNVVILPSLWEGLPNVVLEAMAAGRPVIASTIADNARIVQHGVTGYLFPSDDDKALAECVAAVRSLSNQALEEMGATGRASVLANFSMSTMVRAYERLYDLVAEG